MDHYRFSTGSETIELPLIPDIRKVYVEPTTDCNFACVTCIRHSRSDSIGAMDEATFGRILASRLPTRASRRCWPRSRQATAACPPGFTG